MTANSTFDTQDDYEAYITYLAENILIDAIRTKHNVLTVIDSYLASREQIIEDRAEYILQFSPTVTGGNPRLAMKEDLRHATKDLIAWD